MLGISALQGLRWVESRLQQQTRARLSVTLAADGPSESALRDQLIAAGLSVVGHRVTVECAGGYRSLVFELRRCHRPDDTATPPVIAALASEAGVRKLHWDALR